jgi:hypothetical protein
MKYLKTFEGFGHHDFDDNHLFKQISYDEFENTTYNNSNIGEEVTQEECDWFINLLKQNLFSPFEIKNFDICKIHSTDALNSAINIKLLPKFNHDWTVMILYKYSDDYWVLECMGFGNAYFDGGSDWTYWICDTKEGLVNLVEYYFNNIKEWLPPVTESLSNGDPLYYEISEINPDEKEFVGLDQSVVDKIESRLLSGFILEKKYYTRQQNLLESIYCVISLPDSDFFFDIFQLDDEYFDVEYLDARDKSYGRTMFNSHYYRCDGVEGLLQFLQDENIID